MQTMHKQQGAVLIVSLVMLLAITLIALASLSGSTLETKMVVNQQDKAGTFQEAESGLSQAIRNDNYYSAYQAAKVTPGSCIDEAVTPSKNIHDQDISNLAVTNCYRSQSIAVGEDLNKFVFYHYELNASADSTLGNSSTDLVQGVRRLGPKI